jgi:hypothetical protein
LAAKASSGLSSRQTTSLGSRPAVSVRWSSLRPLTQVLLPGGRDHRAGFDDVDLRKPGTRRPWWGWVARMWAFGWRTTTMESLLVAPDAPGGGLLAVAAPVGCSGGPLPAQVSPGLGWRQAAEPKQSWRPGRDRAGSPGQGNSRGGLGTVTCEQRRATSPSKALRVVPLLKMPAGHLRPVRHFRA